MMASPRVVRDAIEDGDLIPALGQTATAEFASFQSNVPAAVVEVGGCGTPTKDRIQPGFACSECPRCASTDELLKNFTGTLPNGRVVVARAS